MVARGSRWPGRRRRHVMDRASRRLYVLGTILCATWLVCARIQGPVGAPPYLIALGVAAATYLFAMREVHRIPKYPRRAVFICLAMAAVWRVPFLLAPPGPKDD